ncbi:MAG: UDP-glucose 6-dehydrogenase [Chlamydiae bacterium]|nr:MAG: UDP-glucose 6-dehydrogenase [Chlamydiota bacterium]
MNVAIVGTGYVGLVAATCFAESGNSVICVDNNKTKINDLLSGKIPIYEPGLTELVQRNLNAGRLQPTTDTELAVKKSDIIFLAVGTPPGADGSADLSAVFAVAEAVGKAMNRYKIIVNKSTVPVGTADKVREKISLVTNHQFDVVSNPEFMKEGAALDDFLKPERVVIGTSSEKAAEIMHELYSPFTRTGADTLIMDNRSAEMCKYASNAMLAARISFMNEVANICDKVGADVHSVRQAMGLDSRIGRRFLFPGVGYGGSCFPKDVQALAATAKENEYEPLLVDAIEKVNENQKKVLVKKIKKHFGNDLTEKIFAVWGLAFKPQTDDMRAAPSIVIINELLAGGAKVKAYDPVAEKTAKAIFGDKISYMKSRDDVLENADALILITEWNEFRSPDFKKLKDELKHPVIFDGRNQYELDEMKNAGITYYSIGRPAVNEK